MKGNKIFKAAFLVMIISILSRFLGLFRDMLVGYQFGVSIYTDAYKAAVSVPETVFTIVGLAISTVFIPMLGGSVIGYFMGRGAKKITKILSKIARF